MSSYQFSLAAKELYEVRYPNDPPLTEERKHNPMTISSFVTAHRNREVLLTSTGATSVL